MSGAILFTGIEDVELIVGSSLKDLRVQHTVDLMDRLCGTPPMYTSQETVSTLLPHLKDSPPVLGVAQLHRLCRRIPARGPRPRRTRLQLFKQDLSSRPGPGRRSRLRQTTKD